MTRPTRLFLIEPVAQVRLGWVRALSARFEVETDLGELHPVRHVRRGRYGVVLLSLGRGRLTQGLRLCRTLKTDGNQPPKVGLIDRWARVADPEAALAAHLGDGYLGGVPEDKTLLDFVLKVGAGDRPVVSCTPEQGLLARLLRR